MPRPKVKQRRISAAEARLIKTLKGRVKNYRIFWSARRQKEVNFNARLMDYLKQYPNPLDVSNKRIPVAEFVGETFRPEFYLRKGNRAICAVECKRLTEDAAKGRWKAGLSQALLYSEVYRAVILVFFDFTKSSKYHKAFGRGNRLESRFARKLRETNNIHMIVLKPAEE